jgi:hypothetical protein
MMCVPKKLGKRRGGGGRWGEGVGGVGGRVGKVTNCVGSGPRGGVAERDHYSSPP